MIGFGLQAKFHLNRENEAQILDILDLCYFIIVLRRLLHGDRRMAKM